MSSQDPEEIRAEIERTRASISENVDAIGETVSPANVVARQKEKARDAVTSLKDKVMGSADDSSDQGPSRLRLAGEQLGEATSSVGASVQQAPQAVRQRAQGNPLAAGLIAFGVGWLAASLLPSSQRERDLAEQARVKAEPLVAEVKRSASDIVEELKPAAQTAADEVKAAAAEGVQAVKAEGQSVAGGVRDDVDTARQNLSSN